MRRFLLLLALAAPVLASAQGRPNDASPTALIDRSIERMGGEAALRGIRTVRMDVMTQWQRTHLGTHPFGDMPSYERHQDLRDYAANAWRNSRTFVPAVNVGVVDIVRDTIGGRRSTGPTGAPAEAPLNVAYVDERRELFAFAPERTLLLAREAAGLRTLADTAIDGVAHARVTATVDGFPATWFLRRTDGLLGMVRFTADETNDFGLAPWGVMEVEVWFSNWVPVAPGVLLPRQRDVRRVGRPYKRMTVMSFALNAPAPADSFAIADTVVAAFLARERRPMWRVPIDTVSIVERDFMAFPFWIGSVGAVRVGGTWVLLETGQAAGAASIAAERIAATGERVGGGIVSSAATGNGGVAWFAEKRLPLFVAPGAEAMVRRNVGAVAGSARPTIVTSPRWVRVGTDSLWLEPVDVPDFGGSLAVYAPSLRWLYVPGVVARRQVKPELDALIARLRGRGYVIDWIGGTPAGIRAEVPR